MVGPPLTMLLMAEGLLTVQQEMDAGFLETSIFQDKAVPETKKRKYEVELVQKGQEKGESSLTHQNGTSKLLPEVTMAIATPAAIAAEHQLSSKTLEDILERFNQTNSCIEQNLQTWTSLLAKGHLHVIPLQQDLGKGSIQLLQEELTQEKLQKQLLHEELELIKKQHTAELLAAYNAEQGHLQQIKDLHRSPQLHRQSVTKLAYDLHQIKQMAETLKEEIANSTHHTATEIAAQIRKHNLALSPTADQHRALEIAKIEAFDQWINKSEPTKEELTTKQMFDRITSKIGHTFKALRIELAKEITEREDLQERLEQQERSDAHKWENILAQNQIEDPVNLITSTMKNLAPPVSIFQYYHAYKPIILKCTDLPDLKMNSNLSEGQF